MNDLAIDTNLLDPDLFPSHEGPPHELFDLWRREDPVHWNPVVDSYVATMPNSSMTRGFHVLTRYADVFEVSRDQARFTSHDHGFLVWDQEGAGLAQSQANMMGMRLEDHTPLRHLVTPPFSQKAMLEMGPAIERLAREIVDDVVARGECEFVFEVASRLPVYTFCELMGIDEAQRSRVETLGNMMADVEARGDDSEDYPVPELFGICEALCEQKRANPDGSILSRLVHEGVEELGLTQLNINMLFIVFAIAGHETTRSTATQFVRLMNLYPEQYALLRSDVDRYLPNAIEEVIRFANPTTQFCRTATCDTQIGGVPVKAGDKIYLSYAGANRDPVVFEDPHRFDITRSNARKHLAFGTGPHVCLGARLARLELQALLKEIVTRIPDIHMTEPPEFLRSIWFNAIIRMPVAFTPSS